MKTFNASAKMLDEDFYAEYLGKKSEMPYQYRVTHQYRADCPLQDLAETAMCKNFGVGKRRVDKDSYLRGEPTNLNEIQRKTTTTKLYGTAPYKFGYDVRDVNNVDEETSIKYWTSTYGPQRIITELQYDRLQYVDILPVIEPFDKKGKGTRFDSVDVMSARREKSVVM